MPPCIRVARHQRIAGAKVLPEIDRMHGVAQPPQFHPEGMCGSHAASAGEVAAEVLAYAGLGNAVHDVRQAPMFRVAPDASASMDTSRSAYGCAGICHRLHFSNDDTKQIAGAGGQSHAICRRRADEGVDAEAIHAPAKFKEHLELHHMDCLSSHGNLAMYDSCSNVLQERVPKKRSGRRCC